MSGLLETGQKNNPLCRAHRLDGLSVNRFRADGGQKAPLNHFIYIAIKQIIFISPGVAN